MGKKEAFQIMIPEWMRHSEAEKIKVAFCEIINADLAKYPDRSLADFARIFDLANKEATYELIKEGIAKECGRGEYEETPPFYPDGTSMEYEGRRNWNKEDAPF